MLAVVTYRWGDAYGPEHVNTLYFMARNHIKQPFRFFVIGDESPYYHDDILWLPLPDSLRALPRCFPRLGLWSHWTRSLGSRLLMLDLDCVITGNLEPILARREPIVFWRDALARTGPRPYCYNGGFLLMNPEARTEVWTDFPGADKVIGKGFIGSDQAWYAMHFGTGMPVVTEADGVLSYKFDHVRERGLPDGARIVMFHGRPKPWDVQDEWVREHYR